MKAFMDKDFLLSTETAKHLYHDYAAPQPIIDYHCHLSPQEIYEDRRFDTITQVWLGGDHYKWRIMRAMGVEERLVTGDAPDYEKFLAWAKTLSLAIGNPLYHWSHLELQRYFGYTGILNEDTAAEVYALCNEKLARPEFSARNLIRSSNVRTLCTTDDPADSLEWHKKIKEDGFEVAVYPAFRPDQAVNIEKDGFADYLAKLGAAAGVAIDSFAALKKALSLRIDFFSSMGCRVSDHGLETVPFMPVTDAGAEAVMAKKLSGGALTAAEVKQFKTALLLFLGREYARAGWVMQLHYGCIRNNATRLFSKLGADVGVDAIGPAAPADELAGFLNALDETGELPKTILYSLDPNDNAVIETIMGCFQEAGAVGKLQHGSAWWFNDHKKGMTEQITSLASEGMLAAFVGMLTDSRSFLSYARHEYFRRILCDIIGGWVENGEYPADEKALRAIVEGISYNNAKEYFGF